MKRFLLAVLTVTLLANTSVADEKADLIRLKLKGYMPALSLKDIESETKLPQLSMAQKNVLEEHKNCGHPDFPDKEIANAPLKLLADATGMEEQEAGYVQLMHRRMLEATGRGSYPFGCHPDYPDAHVVWMWRDVDSYGAHMKRPLTDEEFQQIIDARVWGPSGDPTQRPFTMSELKAAWGGVPMWQVIDDFTAETYRRVGVIILSRAVHDDQHNIHVRSRVIGGGTIGIGWLPGDDPCPGDHVEFHIDSTYRSGFQGQFGLDVHECGHCMQGPHQFSGQNSHQEPMSYRYSNHLCVGYVDQRMVNAGVVDLPVSPSMALWTRLYGGQPVGIPWRGKFSDTPTDPTDPPQPPVDGDFVLREGEELTLMRANGQKVTLLVKSTSGPDFATQLEAALDKVPDYASKATHRAFLGAIYDGTAKAVSNGTVKPEDAISSLSVLRGFILTSDADKWKPFFQAADQATTAQHFASIASVLMGGQMYVLSEAEQERFVREFVTNLHGRKVEEFLTPEMISILKQIVEWMPESKFKQIITMVLTLMEVLGNKPGDMPMREERPPVKPIQRGAGFPIRKTETWPQIAG